MQFFYTTPRIGFSQWDSQNENEAHLLWSSTGVCTYITVKEQFSPLDIANRITTEKENLLRHGVQYFPIYRLSDNRFMGCCGLRPYGKEEKAYELGFHLLPEFWGQGIGKEAGQGMIHYGFSTLGATTIMAGHHPENLVSKKLLLSLGFCCIGEEHYPPTGLMHPTYRLLP